MKHVNTKHERPLHDQHTRTKEREATSPLLSIPARDTIPCFSPHPDTKVIGSSSSSLPRLGQHQHQSMRWKHRTGIPATQTRLIGTVFFLWLFQFSLFPYKPAFYFCFCFYFCFLSWDAPAYSTSSSATCKRRTMRGFLLQGQTAGSFISGITLTAFCVLIITTIKNEKTFIVTLRTVSLLT